MSASAGVVPVVYVRTWTAGAGQLAVPPTVRSAGVPSVPPKIGVTWPPRAVNAGAVTQKTPVVGWVTLALLRPFEIAVSTIPEELTDANTCGCADSATTAVAAFGTSVRVDSFTLSPVTALLAILPVVIELSAIFAVVTAFFLIFEVVTASLTILPVLTEFPWSWLAPIFFAAKAVAPPSTRNTAIEDITFAYVSRLRICFTGDISLVEVRKMTRLECPLFAVNQREPSKLLRKKEGRTDARPSRAYRAVTRPLRQRRADHPDFGPDSGFGSPGRIEHCGAPAAEPLTAERRFGVPGAYRGTRGA